MKRAKVIITHERLRRLLALPETVEIVALTADNDPLTLQVHLAGEGLPPESVEQQEWREREGRNVESEILDLAFLQRIV